MPAHECNRQPHPLGAQILPLAKPARKRGLFFRKASKTQKPSAEATDCLLLHGSSAGSGCARRHARSRLAQSACSCRSLSQARWPVWSWLDSLAASRRTGARGCSPVTNRTPARPSARTALPACGPSRGASTSTCTLQGWQSRAGPYPGRSLQARPHCCSSYAHQPVLTSALVAGQQPKTLLRQLTSGLVVQAPASAGAWGDLWVAPRGAAVCVMRHDRLSAPAFHAWLRTSPTPGSAKDQACATLALVWWATGARLRRGRRSVCR